MWLLSDEELEGPLVAGSKIGEGGRGGGATVNFRWLVLGMLPQSSQTMNHTVLQVVWPWVFGNRQSYFQILGQPT